MKIKDFAQQVNIEESDIRMMISETNPKFDTVSSLSQSEIELIRRAIDAKSLGSSQIDPLTTSDLTIQEQNQLVTTAAQVLDCQIQLSIIDTLNFHEAIAETQNLAIQHIYRTKEKELAFHFQQENKQRKEAFIGTLNTIADMVGDDVQLENDGEKSEVTTSVFLAQFKKKLLK